MTCIYRQHDWTLSVFGTERLRGLNVEKHARCFSDRQPGVELLTKLKLIVSKD